MAGFGAPGAAESKQCIVESKLGVREQLGEAMEQDIQSAPKKFGETVKRLRRAKRNLIQTGYSGGAADLSEWVYVGW